MGATVRLLHFLEQHSGARLGAEAAGIWLTLELNGEDPVAYILSANINRRHLTKGQRAMIVAKLYPDPRKLKRRGGSLGSKDLSEARISQARTVLEFAPELADLVLAGKPLDEAYATALERKRAAGLLLENWRLLNLRLHPRSGRRPVEVTQLADKFDISVHVAGGGITGQAALEYCVPRRAFRRPTLRGTPEARSPGPLGSSSGRTAEES